MIKAAICSERMPHSAKKKLEAECERVFLLPSEDALFDAVCHHPDMILSVVGKKLLCHRAYFEKNKEFLAEMCDFLELEPVPSDCLRGKKYPLDIAFNVLTADRYLFCNEKYTAPELLANAKGENLQIINVSQGYAACSSLFVKGTVITADPSIINAASGKLPVLPVQAGGILLEPYDTGFIGGSAGYADGVLYTFGELDSFKGAGVLTDFLDRENISVCPLLEGTLSDYGGIKLFEI